MMDTQQILTAALQLKETEKFSIINALLYSIDKPESEIDAVWEAEAEKRLLAYREGRIKGVAFEEIFNNQA